MVPQGCIMVLARQHVLQGVMLFHQQRIVPNPVFELRMRPSWSETMVLQKGPARQERTVWFQLTLYVLHKLLPLFRKYRAVHRSPLTSQRQAERLPELGMLFQEYRLPDSGDAVVCGDDDGGVLRDIAQEPFSCRIKRMEMIPGFAAVRPELMAEAVERRPICIGIGCPARPGLPEHARKGRIGPLCGPAGMDAGMRSPDPGRHDQGRGRREHGVQCRLVKDPVPTDPQPLSGRAVDKWQDRGNAIGLPEIHIPSADAVLLGGKPGLQGGYCSGSGRRKHGIELAGEMLDKDAASAVFPDV